MNKRKFRASVTSSGMYAGNGNEPKPGGKDPEPGPDEPSSAPTPTK